MAMLVLDNRVEKQVKAERQISGADRYDEVWDGVYVVSPLPDNEHQDVRTGLGIAIQNAVGFDGPVQIYAGVNVSDRIDLWLFNVRIPDVAVVFPGGAARDCKTHYCGGPDFCAEVTSPGDRSRDKLDFYAGIGVRELLVIDRDPWAQELYRLNRARLEPVGRSDLAKADALASAVVPVSFRLVPGTKRPAIEVVHRDGVQRWLV